MAVRMVSPGPQPAARLRRAVQHASLHDLAVVDLFAEERDDRLRDHQADVLLHPLLEPSEPVMRRRPGRRYGVDEDLAVPDLDRIGGHVVGEQVEGAAAGQVEAGVMPVAGEDAVLDGAAVKRKAHVRAAVIDRVDLVVVIKHGDRAVLAGHHLTPLLLQLGQAADSDLAVRAVRHGRHLRRRRQQVSGSMGAATP